jgi:acyl-[acyl-carrier-protein] desaturase
MLHESTAIPDRYAVLRSIDGFVGENLSFLAPLGRVWQPTDYLPDLASEDWREQVQAFRESAQSISDEALVVLVGDMVTEEALPNYSVSLERLVQESDNQLDGSWARWLRGWTAEENRHGDLLNAYLRLTGRVNIRAVEETVQRLIVSGFNPRTGGDPYKGMVYTAFQERATKVSHGNVGRIALAQGDANLASICQRIAGDESRHEAFYTRIMGRILDSDPEGGIIAFRDMLRGLISMPGAAMDDGRDPQLFEHFAAVAQRLKVYTVHDYAQIIEHLVKTWAIADRCVSGKAARAQEYLCRQTERFAVIADEMAARVEKQPPVAFAWINDRKV